MPPESPPAYEAAPYPISSNNSDSNNSDSNNSDSNNSDSNYWPDWDGNPWTVDLTSPTTVKLFSTLYLTYDNIWNDILEFYCKNSIGPAVQRSSKNKTKTEVIKVVL